jgi:uridylate kinase
MLPKFKRILLKLSGESLMGDKTFGLDSGVISMYAEDIKNIVSLGVQVAIVIGGGNIYRGMNEAETGIERAHGDYMGMLATVINGMALQAGLEKIGVYTRLQSAIKMEQIAEPYIHPPPGKRPRCHFRGRHRQPVFYNRHGRLAPRHRN